MWTRLSVASLALGTLFVGVATPAAAAGPCNPSTADTAIDAEESAMLSGINSYRQQHGLNPLTYSYELRSAAPWMGRDMAGHNFMPQDANHTDSLGRSMTTRLYDCNFSASPEYENIAYGYPDAARTLTQWKNSPTHNANLLNVASVVAGIARAQSASGQWYWILDLGNYNTLACSTRIWAGC
jgi:uncharacterized protein YkwD